MSGKNRVIIVKIISVTVAACAVLAAVGWIFDIRFLKSISPYWISMKFDTTVAFFLSGVTLYFISSAKEGEFDRAQVVISVTSLILFLLMGVLFFSAIFGVRTGAEDLFVQEEAGGVKTVSPGLPSIPTMGNFLLIATMGVLTILNYKNQPLMLKAVGFIIGITGLTAVLGYIVNFPLLYYYVEGMNSAMAAHSGALFILLGLGFVCL